MNQARERALVQTLTGCVIALMAAGWAMYTNNAVGWVVAMVGAGIADPALLRAWFTPRAYHTHDDPPTPPAQE
jgi:hypothetical protein